MKHLFLFEGYTDNEFLKNISEEILGKLELVSDMARNNPKRSSLWEEYNIKTDYDGTTVIVTVAFNVNDNYQKEGGLEITNSTDSFIGFDMSIYMNYDMLENDMTKAKTLIYHECTHILQHLKLIKSKSKKVISSSRDKRMPYDLKHGSPNTIEYVFDIDEITAKASSHLYIFKEFVANNNYDTFNECLNSFNSKYKNDYDNFIYYYNNKFLDILSKYEESFIHLKQKLANVKDKDYMTKINTASEIVMLPSLDTCMKMIVNFYTKILRLDYNGLIPDNYYDIFMNKIKKFNINTKAEGVGLYKTMVFFVNEIYKVIIIKKRLAQRAYKKTMKEMYKIWSEKKPQ